VLFRDADEQQREPAQLHVVADAVLVVVEGRSATHPRPLIISMPPLSRNHHPPTAGNRPQLNAAASVEATEQPQQLLADGIRALAESLDAYLTRPDEPRLAPRAVRERGGDRLTVRSL
jgi:hypothetical protein